MNNIKEMLDSMLKGIPEYHADAAIFYSPANGWSNAWSVHIGNPCPAVALGEICGIYVGNGGTLEQAMHDAFYKVINKIEEK